MTTRSLGGPSVGFETGERVQVRHVDEATNQEVWLNGNITEIVHANQEGGGRCTVFFFLILAVAKNLG